MRWLLLPGEQIFFQYLQYKTFTKFLQPNFMGSSYTSLTFLFGARLRKSFQRLGIGKASRDQANSPTKDAYAKHALSSGAFRRKLCDRAGPGTGSRWKKSAPRRNRSGQGNGGQQGFAHRIAN